MSDMDEDTEALWAELSGAHWSGAIPDLGNPNIVFAQRQIAEWIMRSDWLAAHVDARVADALAPIEMLTDPEEMGRAMWKASGLNEDLILLAQEPAANALRAAMEAKG